MGRAEVEIDIDRPAAAVWDVVRDFGGLARWMPGIDSCTVDGDTRTLAVLGTEIIERHLGTDDERRETRYSIVGGGVPVTHHQATITVAERGSDACHVTWAFEVEPETLVPVLTQSYTAALKALAGT